MKQISVANKTGFKIANPNRLLVIRDADGRIFYTNEGLIPNVKAFNLPGGLRLFLDQGAILRMPFPVKYKLFQLPKRQRFLKPSPRNFKVSFAKNPNRCTIDWNARTITYDTYLKNASIPTNLFILYHEYGHQYYGTEKYADLYSANCMLRRGFNPSQIGMTIIMSLSPEQIDRKQFIIEKLVQNARS